MRQGDVLVFDNEHHQAQLLCCGLYGLHLQVLWRWKGIVVFGVIRGETGFTSFAFGFVSFKFICVLIWGTVMRKSWGYATTDFNNVFDGVLLTVRCFIGDVVDSSSIFLIISLYFLHGFFFILNGKYKHANYLSGTGVLFGVFLHG
jgi:hypothetical protein